MAFSIHIQSDLCSKYTNLFKVKSKLGGYLFKVESKIYLFCLLQKAVWA